MLGPTNCPQNLKPPQHERLTPSGLPLGGCGKCLGDVAIQKEPLARRLCFDGRWRADPWICDATTRTMGRVIVPYRCRLGLEMAGDLPYPLAAWSQKLTHTSFGRVVTLPNMPSPRGPLIPERPLADLTWLRVGGAADWFFQPADVGDLQDFLKELPRDIAVFPMGVGSNLIVRDGGIRAVVMRMGRGFNEISFDGTRVTAGVAALDAHVARKAANQGLDLTFLRTIPGAIGGAVRMNAGCYGSYVADVFVEARAVTRDGDIVTLKGDDLKFEYRQSELPDGWVIIDATFEAPLGDPDELNARMEAQLKKRDETQPTKDRTAGSTFRNPAGFSSTGKETDTHELKAWKVIDDAGCRGLTLGGAQMSPKHPNFLVNTGGATAADLENLGEEVRKKVFQNSGIHLKWEIMRVGEAG